MPPFRSLINPAGRALPGRLGTPPAPPDRPPAALPCPGTPAARAGRAHPVATVALAVGPGGRLPRRAVVAAPATTPLAGADLRRRGRGRRVGRPGSGAVPRGRGPGGHRAGAGG